MKRIFKNSVLNENNVDDILLRALLDGEEITKDKALTLPAVSAAVSKISNTIAMIPFKLYKETADEQGKLKVEEVKNDRRVALINDDTRDTLDGFQFKKALVTDYLLGKGGYAYIENFRNTFIGLYYIDERNISIYTSPDVIKKNYEIEVIGSTDRYKNYQFIKLLRNTKDGASGTSLISEVSKAIETAYSTLCLQLRASKTGGIKKGFIKSKKKLDKASIDLLKSGWQNMYSTGSENVVVLNDGIEFQEASDSAIQMQISQTKQALNADIDKAFGIIADDTLFFKYTINPIIVAFETALNRDMLLEKEKATYFWAADTKEITKVSLKERFEAYKTGIDGHIISPNEARYFENLDYVPGLDVISLSLGNVLFDINTGKYYVPNTGEGGEN